MVLKYYKTYSNSKITVNLALTKFTCNEQAAVKILGAPDIILNKTYTESNLEVSIESVISPAFQIEYNFPGTTDNIGAVINEVDQFIDDVKEAVTEKMAALMIIYNQIKRLLDNQTGELIIKDGEETVDVSPTIKTQKLSCFSNVEDYSLKNAKVGGRGIIDTPKLT